MTQGTRPRTGGDLLLALDRSLRHDPEELRQRADELLSRPPYAAEEPGVFERVVRWLGDLVARAVQLLVDTIAAGGTAGAWAVAVVGMLVLGIAVWRFTRGAGLDRRTPEAVAAPAARAAASWRAEAKRHDEQGRPREAVRCWYGAAVASLVEQGRLDDVPGRTVRELSDEVARRAPGLHPAFVAAGERFEAVVYGRRTPTVDDVRLVRQADEAASGVPA